MKSFKKDKIVYEPSSPLRIDDNTVAQMGPDGIVHGYDKSIADSEMFKQLESQNNIMTKISSKANADAELSASKGWFTQEQEFLAHERHQPSQSIPTECSPCNLYDLAPGVFLIVSADNPISSKKIQALMQLLSD